jgi:hypothetical protein
MEKHDLERAKGIEPSYAAWEAAVLPLNYARESPDLAETARSAKRVGRWINPFSGFPDRCWTCHRARQIIRAMTGAFRNITVSAQLIDSVPANTIANLTKAGKAGS